MTADDNLGDGETEEGEFNRGSFRLIARRTASAFARGDEIPHVSHDEEIARIGRGEEVRYHAAIGTSDEEGIGFLPKGELRESVLARRPDVFAEIHDPADELSHDEGCFSQNL